MALKRPVLRVPAGYSCAGVPTARHLGGGGCLSAAWLSSMCNPGGLPGSSRKEERVPVCSSGHAGAEKSKSCRRVLHKINIIVTSKGTAQWQ